MMVLGPQVARRRSASALGSPVSAGHPLRALSASFGVNLGTRVEPRFSGLLFAVVLGPMMLFGCAYYPWMSLEAWVPFQWLFLLNPLVFMSEAMRLAVTPGNRAHARPVDFARTHRLHAGAGSSGRPLFREGDYPLKVRPNSNLEESRTGVGTVKPPVGPAGHQWDSYLNRQPDPRAGSARSSHDAAQTQRSPGAEGLRR